MNAAFEGVNMHTVTTSRHLDRGYLTHSLKHLFDNVFNSEVMQKSHDVVSFDVGLCCRAGAIS